MSSPSATPADAVVTRSRKGSSSATLKEKVVQYYEAIFQNKDPSLANPNFWDEFFLLKANVEELERQFERLGGDELALVKVSINNLFYRCVEGMKSSHRIKVVNVVQTLSGLVRGLFTKSAGTIGFDAIDILIGFDSAETVMQSLIDVIHKILTDDGMAVSLKSLCLRFLLTLVTATDNISQNTLLEYLMMNSVFESLVQILENGKLRVHHGNDAAILLALLVQYRKYESTNPYIVNLSILDNELALNGLAQVVAASLTTTNRAYAKRSEQEQSSGFFSTLSSMVGSMFTGGEERRALLETNDAVLLAMYEAIHLNRNFITTLATAVATTASRAPTATLLPDETDAAASAAAGTPGAMAAEAELQLALHEQPSNLLVTFLEFASIIMQDTKDKSALNSARLAFIVLTCIVEDQYANSLMHDVNMNYRVPLHKKPMRHRKATLDPRPQSRPLACGVIDLMNEFLVSHLMKNMPDELYMFSLGIIHRLLCYQKKCRIRLQYPWKVVWSALINLLKYLLSNEASLLQQFNIFDLSYKAVSIFNMFITYGDTFLAAPTSYDELYYEIIRMHQVFDNLYSMSLRHTTMDGTWKEAGLRLTNALGNVRAIINHFSPKVESWAAINRLSSLTEEQVLDVVRANYDTLILKLHDQLDQHERYNEKPRETAFFTLMVRSIVADVKKTASVSKPEHASLLLELGTMATME